MAFWGREDELKRLADFYASPGQGVALVFGRRRVGKSELIKHSLQNEVGKAVYYECKQTSEVNNVSSLSALLSEVLSLPPLAFSSIEQLLEFIFTRAYEHDLVLVLDEYPYLRNVVEGLDSILQSLIDAHRDRSHIKLVVCGSYVETMKSLLQEANPLFGRVDLAINLKPMDYWDSALFYPEFTNEDKVRLYSVFGGIPYYNQLIDSRKSVQENIVELIASPGARLENEVLLYLGSEIKKMVNANEAFEALASGFSRFGDILQQSHVSSSPALADTLNKLMEMELVEKTFPINDPSNKKKTGYRICDNTALFYYRFIFRNQSQLAVMEPNRFYERYIQSVFDEHYVPERFEGMCRQFLIRLNKKNEAPIPFDLIGKYWYDIPAEKRNGEFDIVTYGEAGYTFYEAKFRAKPISRAMVVEELRQVEAAGLDVQACGFISRSGFESFEEPTIIKLTLDDLYV